MGDCSSLGECSKTLLNECLNVPSHELLISELLKGSNDVIYDGGLEDRTEEREFKIEPVELDSNNVEENPEGTMDIDVRGVKYKVPYAIECHLCNEMMNLCVRRTRYRGQSREYAAYRCNRKGCQTFRSIRKVFSRASERKNTECNESSSTSTSSSSEPLIPQNQSCVQSDELSDDDDNDELVVQRIFLPKQECRSNTEQKPLSVTDRMRKANQERATVYTEFADRLRHNIVANKRCRIRKQLDKDDHQGTLFYINKELTPQEVIELQDTIIKAMISFRKIPPPMTMHDLPLFANTPYSKKQIDSGLAKSQDNFWKAFTDSPQPPLPEGFIRRRDDTLIYRDPKPYEVPEILRENSPRKQADAIAKYKRRKEEQEAKRLERRHVEKKYRSWASLKREFDMAASDDRPASKMSKGSGDSDLQSRPVTLKQLMNKIGDNTAGQLSCRIRAGSSEYSNDSFQWIDLTSSDEMRKEDSSEEPNVEKCSEEERKNEEDDDIIEIHSKLNPSSSATSVQDVMKTLSNSTPLTSSLLKSFSSMESLKTPLTSHPSMFFPDSPFLNCNQPSSAFYTLSPFLPPYQLSPSFDGSFFYHNKDFGASEIVRTETTAVPPFTYIHPDSGIRLTDPSAFLTSFIPSPITKVAPINFSEETTKNRRSSEPSTSSAQVNVDGSGEKDGSADDKKEEFHNFSQLDPSQIIP